MTEQPLCPFCEANGFGICEAMTNCGRGPQPEVITDDDFHASHDLGQQQAAE